MELKVDQIGNIRCVSCLDNNIVAGAVTCVNQGGQIIVSNIVVDSAYQRGEILHLLFSKVDDLFSTQKVRLKELIDEDRTFAIQYYGSNDPHVELLPKGE